MNHIEYPLVALVSLADKLSSFTPFFISLSHFNKFHCWTDMIIIDIEALWALFVSGVVNYS